MMPWNGGSEVRGKKVDLMLSGPDTVAWWAQHNRCDPSPATAELDDNNSADSSTVTRMEYSHCETPVVFYRINGGGHTWPRITKRGNKVMRAVVTHIFGQTNRDIDSGETIWNFFKPAATKP